MLLTLKTRRYKVAQSPGAKRELHMDFVLQLINDAHLADHKCVQHSTDLHLFRSTLLGISDSLMHSRVQVRTAIPQFSYYNLLYYCKHCCQKVDKHYQSQAITSCHKLVS